MTEQPKPRGSISRRRRDGDDESMMDINEVAAFLNTSVRHIRRLVSERRIPHYKIGGKLRFGRREIHDWVDSQRVVAEDPTGWRIRPHRRRAS